VKQVTAVKLAKAITQKGWKLARIKGSHHVYIMNGRQERIVIPFHGNTPLKVGLLKSLMNIAGLSEKDI